MIEHHFLKKNYWRRARTLRLSISATKDNSILLSGFGFPLDNDSYSDAFVYKLDENGKLSSIGDQTELSATSMVYQIRSKICVRSIFQQKDFMT